MGNNSEGETFLQKIYSMILFLGQIWISLIIGVTFWYPFLFFLFAINESVRSFVRVGLWLVYRGRIQLCSDSGSSVYSVIRPDLKHMVLYVAEVDGPVDVSEIRRNYQKRVVENPGYTSLVKSVFEPHWGYVCLRECSNFDVANHVRIYPGSEKRIMTEKDLLEDILPNLSHDMSSDKPQWEEVIVPNYQPKLVGWYPRKSLRILRCHHSYMDGASTLIMIANTFTDDNTSEPFPYVIDPTKPLKISAIKMFYHKLVCFALLPWYGLKNCVTPPNLRTSRFSVASPSETTLFAWTKPIPMEKLSSIKDKSGVSMPAIVNSVLGGAIHNFEVRYPSKKKQDEISVILIVGMFPYKKNEPCNHHLCLEARINASDVTGCERLAALNEELGRCAQNPQVTINYWFTQMGGRWPASIIKFFTQFAFGNIVVSNVPISTERVKLWGKECSQLVGFLPMMTSFGLGVVSVRYADHFRYCLQADSSIITESQLKYFVEQIESEVDALCEEASHLKRRFSTDVTLYARGKELPGPDELRKARFEDSGYNNNNSASSFLFKLKDSFEQIREGIIKIKEQ